MTPAIVVGVRIAVIPAETTVVAHAVIVAVPMVADAQTAAIPVGTAATPVVAIKIAGLFAAQNEEGRGWQDFASPDLFDVGRD